MCYDPFVLTWRKPAYSDEVHKLEDAAGRLGLSVPEIKQAFEAGELVDVPGWVWCSLDNSNSSDCFCLAEAEARAKLHGRDDDLARITTGMIQHKIFPAPVILTRGEKRPYLVSGNLRLLACRGLGIRPKVWLMKAVDDGS